MDSHLHLKLTGIELLHCMAPGQREENDKRQCGKNMKKQKLARPKLGPHWDSRTLSEPSRTAQEQVHPKWFLGKGELRVKPLLKNGLSVPNDHVNFEPHEAKRHALRNI